MASDAHLPRVKRTDVMGYHAQSPALRDALPLGYTTGQGAHRSMLPALPPVTMAATCSRPSARSAPGQRPVSAGSAPGLGFGLRLRVEASG